MFNIPMPCMQACHADIIAEHGWRPNGLASGAALARASRTPLITAPWDRVLVGPASGPALTCLGLALDIALERTGPALRMRAEDGEPQQGGQGHTESEGENAKPQRSSGHNGGRKKGVMTADQHKDKQMNKRCKLCLRTCMSIDPVNSLSYLRWGKCKQRIITIVDETGEPRAIGRIDYWCQVVWENVAEYQTMT